MGKKFIEVAAGVAVLAAVFASAPLYVPEALIWILGMSFLFIVIAMSWDLVTGYAGQINLGLTSFVGLGAYTSALLQVTSRLKGTPFEFLAGQTAVPVELSLLAGGVSSALVGAAIGGITLRLKGWYLALVTAILPIAFVQTTYVWKDVFGGEEGFTLPAGLAQTPIGKYYAALAVMLLSLATMLLITRSNISLRLKALRDEPELAESIGLDTVKLKILAFTASAFFAGIAGAAIVNYRQVANNDLYDVPLMLLVILAVVIGGSGTIWGPVVGGLLVYTMKLWWLKGVVYELVSSTGLPINDDVILYAILIALAILAPKGLWPVVNANISKILRRSHIFPR
ncbi:MAG: branched-chain amino acid ABC transporter permease [Candidatus Caldarchaeum sp.]|uniref:Branched-chain amino acid ABC transporter permease n=1 Tax=Caldiarchaeum subterraneum TaxID=311458 RepID=A0A7C5Q615_CALS0